MRPSPSISSNDEPLTATSPLTFNETSPKPSRIMPLNSPPHATTIHPTNAAKAPRQIVTNGHASYEPPPGEQARFGPPQAEKVPPRETSKRPEPRDVDPSSLDQMITKQHDHPPSPPMDPPTSGRSLASSALGMTKAHSRRPQEPAPQAPRGIPVPPESPVIPNETRETGPSKMKGGHDTLNGQPAPTKVSSPVRHSTAKEVPSLPIITPITAHNQSCLLYISHRLQIAP
jgi:hypothetical protein